MIAPSTMKSSTQRAPKTTRNKAVVLTGPTAVGKTKLTETLFSSCSEIINADSVQVYRGLDIGSAKPDAALRALIPHHLLDIRDPWEQYTAGDFVRDAMALIPEIGKHGRIPLVTGGTGYYIRQLVYGQSEAPAADPSIRSAVASEIADKGLEWAYAELGRVDPLSHARISANDAYRISRALEVHRQTGRPLSSFRVPSAIRDDVDFVLICLVRDRGELDSMGASRSWPAMNAIGYREALDARDSGEASVRILKEDIIRATRQYAKRQMTFFRSFSQCGFFHPDDIDAIRSYLALNGVCID